MSEAVIHRLSKVAKELNISTGTIVEFLKGKGHAIESNPNAKLSAEQYDLLSDGFLSEKKDKEEFLPGKYQIEVNMDNNTIGSASLELE